MKTTVRLLVLWIMSTIFMMDANAEPVHLDASEIEKLLAGNTAIGKWNGTEYRQYFSVDGTTIYATKLSKSSLGKWRINSANNTYESWWNHGTWDGYSIVKDNDQLFWKDKAVAYQFEIVSGQQLVWPK